MLAFVTLLVPVHFKLHTVYDPVRICHFWPLNQIHLSKIWRYEVVLARNPIPSGFWDCLMLYWPFGSSLSHFGPFWCTSWVTPPPPHDWFRLLSPWKCPFYSEMGHISDSGQIWNTFAMLTIWINFGLFWSILVHLMGDPTTPPWLFLTPIPFQVSI